MTYMSVTRKPDCAGLRNLDTTSSIIYLMWD